jgi:hypothetical protein
MILGIFSRMIDPIGAIFGKAPVESLKCIAFSI